MQNANWIRVVASFGLVAVLAACGGGDDAPAVGAAAAAPPAGGDGPSCDTASATGAIAATAAQLSAAAGSYVGKEGDGPTTLTTTATLVFGAGGATTYKGAAQTIQSVCWVPADNMLIVSWSKSPGAGFYLNHVDLRSGLRANGGVNGKIFIAPL